MTAHATPAENESGSEAKLCFSSAARITAALAATAVPFATTHSEEAERWLRILRMNGAVGNAMQALGVREEPLGKSAGADADDSCQPGTVDAVIAAAEAGRQGRRGNVITSEDLLVGVRDVYAAAFEQALATRGTTSSEVLEFIARRAANPTALPAS
jgi:hypothetical protein